MAIFTAIAGYLTTALVGAGLSLAAAGVVANLTLGAALLGVSLLVSSAKQTPTAPTQKSQVTINQSTGPRIRGYGKARLGGTRAFWDTRNGGLDQIVMCHSGRIDAFEQFYIGDTGVSLGPVGAVTTVPFNDYVQIVTRKGQDDQDAHTTMLDRWPDVWTPAHRLAGIANYYVLFSSPPSERFQTIFPESYNTPVTCVCRLSLVWDPRDPGQLPDDPETWLWSDTAALCILDYLRHADGYRLSINDIDVSSFIAKANIDEQMIQTLSGFPEKRYRLWGVYEFTEDPETVLGRMRAASDAEFYQTPAGKVAIRGGIWSAPTVTITDADILSHSMEEGNNRFAAFNELKILYTSPEHEYQTMEATAWVDLVDQEARGPLPSDLGVEMAPSASQARRLAKIHIAKSNPRWKGSISANLSALDALGERIVRIKLPELEIDDAFFVAGFSIRPDLTGVEISVLSISEASYTWDYQTEELEAPPIPQPTRPDLNFPVPATPTLSQLSGVITATVADPGRDELDLQAQIRKGVGANWQPMNVADGSLSATFSGATAGTYQVRGRWLGPLNTAGEWSALAEITF